MKEERVQQQQRQEFATMLHSRDEELQRLQEKILQLSSSNNINSSVSHSLLEIPRNKLGYKLKPDTFDGGVPLQEFLSQFNLIARSNAWNNLAKTIVLASCLRGKVRFIFDGMAEIESITFSELKAKLELRFGEKHSVHSYYLQFTN